MNPISLKPLRTQRINVSSSSQSQQITMTPGIHQIEVTNDGTATVWVEFGGSTVTASMTPGTFPVGCSKPIPAGAMEVLTVKYVDGPIYAAAIAAGSTGYVYFSPGQGI